MTRRPLPEAAGNAGSAARAGAAGAGAGLTAAGAGVAAGDGGAPWTTGRGGGTTIWAPATSGHVTPSTVSAATTPNAKQVRLIAPW